MATTINTGLTKHGLNGAFFQKLRDTPTLHGDLATQITSVSAEEEYKWLGQLPMPREWIGARQSKALADFGMTIKNRLFEATIKFARTDWDDDKTGQHGLRAGELGARFAQHPDKLLIDLMLAADSTLGYDGQNFFDTDHQDGDSGIQSNKLNHDVVTPTAPTNAEFEAAFWKAVEAIAEFKDDQGEPWNLFNSFEDLGGLVVCVPTKFLKVASTVLGANSAPLINSNTNILSGRAKVKTTPRLTWADKFAVFKTDDIIRPFIFQDREAISTYLKDDESEKDLEFGAKARYALGLGIWSKAVQVTFV